MTMSLSLVAVLFQSVLSLSLTTSATVVEIGDSVTLTWATPSADAFLTGVGRVPGTGTVAVRPTASGEYVLVASVSGQLRSARVKIEVRGIRGAIDFPDLSAFNVVLATGERANIAFADFTGRVNKALADEAYTVRGDLLPGSPHWLLYTNYRPQPTLLRENESGVRFREAAYAVRINDKGNGRVFYELFTLVRYQRRAESRIREETDQQVIQIALSELKKIVDKP